MQVKINPSIVAGTVTAPPSKSCTQRAYAAALLHEGRTVLIRPGKSNDDLAVLRIIQSLGAEIMINKDEVHVHSRLFQCASKEINCEESGLAARMFTPIVGLSKTTTSIKGTGSLLNRPMHFFDEILPQLGVSVRSDDGKLPLEVTGPLQPADIRIDGSLSSQFLTGLLFAYGYAATKPVVIAVDRLTSKPYIDLTLEVLQHFGYNITNHAYKQFIITPKDKNTGEIIYTVESDWSSAAFLLVAGAIAGEIKVEGLNIASSQADKNILQALMMAGTQLSIEKKYITVSNGSLHPFHFDATDCPDLFPPLVALAAYCNGISVIKGVNRLQYKESNRALSLQEEFAKMGINIKLEADKMIIEGDREIKAATIHSHHDHRIAMACSIVALKANGETLVEAADAVNKSYPVFFNHLKMLGADVSLPGFVQP